MDYQIERKDQESSYQSIETSIVKGLPEETWKKIRDYYDQLDRLEYLKYLLELQKIKRRTNI